MLGWLVGWHGARLASWVVRCWQTQVNCLQLVMFACFLRGQSSVGWTCVCFFSRHVVDQRCHLSLINTSTL